jgi:hypothetical protein
MQYKTIVLQLLEQHPEIVIRLRSQRLLLPTLESLSTALKSRHEAWKDQLSRRRPGSSASQIASEALEIALKEVEDRFSSASPAEESVACTLEGAMAFIRRHSPPA